ncbi:GtrA family protein [Patescibacteria group bacterium]|nr:GtrA family protein [Patescibacteria group bacterium]
MIKYIEKLAEKYPSILQFPKFITVGAINATIDFGILNLLMYLTSETSGIFFSFFKSISFVVAVTNSYILNKHWTFKSSKETKNGEFFKFIIVNIIGCTINVSWASYVVNVIGAPIDISPMLWANIGAASAVAFTVFWNFCGAKFFVFKK